ncbi:MAG: glycosyltransferase family 4 protein [Candidatus Kariarchaeaceae archaeon]|jgi:glycosyltransferase involved in cell wall biosynthesis
MERDAIYYLYMVSLLKKNKGHNDLQVAIVTDKVGLTGTSVYALEIFKVAQKSSVFDISLIELDHSTQRTNITSKDDETTCVPISLKFPQKHLFYSYAFKKIPKFDLLHFTTQNLSYLAPRNSIITCLDLIYKVYPEKSFRPIIAAFLYKGLKRNRILVAISESTKQDLINEYSIPPEKIRVIHLAADLNHFVHFQNCSQYYSIFGLNPEYRHILVLGSGTRRKNTEGVLYALAILKRRDQLTKTKLLIAGQYLHKSDKHRIQSLISKLGLSENVDFLGRISNDHLPLLYNVVDIFVFPSFYEGFGLPVIEAMACGTPVITSNISSLPEITGDAGILINPYAPREIADAIQSILDDRPFALELSRKGLMQSSKFSWDRTWKMTERIYSLFSEL